MSGPLTAREMAMSLLERGFWPTVIYPAGWTMPNGKVSNGKEPVGAAWGETKLTAAGIEKWFKEIPGAGVGICLGPGKCPGGEWLVDIEIDDRVTGGKNLLKLFGGEIPATMGWESFRGGHRLFYLSEFQMSHACGLWLPGNKIAELPGIELRGFGHGQCQSVTPPTIGTHGQPRRWNDCNEIAPLPAAAYEFLRLVRPVEPSRNTRCDTRSSNGELTHGASGAYGTKVLREECDKVAAAPEGCRHVAMRAGALKIESLVKAGFLNGQQARDELAGAGCQSGLPETEVQELFDWAAAKAGPRAVPGLQVRPESNSVASTHSDSTLTHSNGTPMHLEKNDTHALPKALQKKACAAIPQACVATARACVALPEKRPQAYVAVLSTEVLEVIHGHALLSGVVFEGKVIFDLVRELEPIASKNHWQDVDWKAAVLCWLAASQSNGAKKLPLPHSALACLKRKRSLEIKEPFGAAMARARARMPHVVVPPQLVGSKFEQLIRAMIALSEEASQRGESAFYCSCRDIGSLADGIDGKQAHRWLGALSHQGFISLIEAGTQGTRSQGKASTWQLHDPPCPGKTVWNSNKAILAASNASDPSTAEEEIDF